MIRQHRIPGFGFPDSRVISNNGCSIRCASNSLRTTHGKLVAQRTYCPSANWPLQIGNSCVNRTIKRATTAVCNQYLSACIMGRRKVRREQYSAVNGSPRIDGFEFFALICLDYFFRSLMELWGHESPSEGRHSLLPCLGVVTNLPLPSLTCLTFLMPIVRRCLCVHTELELL